jgi:hypothetical protein
VGRGLGQRWRGGAHDGANLRPDGGASTPRTAPMRPRLQPRTGDGKPFVWPGIRLRRKGISSESAATAAASPSRGHPLSEGAGPKRSRRADPQRSRGTCPERSRRDQNVPRRPKVHAEP